ncbi:tetratricopeptide repeat protein [Pseudomonas anuradhapurensis]|uniref:tetratricopeptide repeat protein n=1 Tax=Pseudomonas anuradhapurensis TaxID=485870 RepID=UPI00164560E6|nr:tetratricopeptide repeat protein [Pseudomonas anuradhapurensis]QXI46919.1 tetratricopeptide repeat protein [Pseudomonas anuradhapurensis]
MNRIGLLLTMIAVLSGCQSMGPELNGVRSVYSAGNSVLYQVQTQSNSPDQAMQVAAMAYQAGDLDQALYQYLRVLELAPERYEALVWVGRIHRERGNNQLAEMAFNEVLAKAPDNPDALTELGLMNLSMRKYEQAKALLSKAVAVDQKRFVKDPANTQTGTAALRVDNKSPLKAYNGLGVLADLGDNFAEAQMYYRLAELIEPRSAFVQNSLGYSYYMAGQWGEAEQHYKRGVSYDGTYKPLWRNYGLLLARMARYEEAVSAFEQVEKRAEASNDVGYVCLVEGKLDIAEQFFRSAIEQSPGHYPVAWENLNRVQQVRQIRQLGGNAPVAEPVAVGPAGPVVQVTTASAP